MKDEAKIGDLQVIKLGIYFQKWNLSKSTASSLLNFFLKRGKDEREEPAEAEILIFRLGCFQKLLNRTFEFMFLRKLSTSCWGLERSFVSYWVPEREGRGPAMSNLKP